MDHLTRVKGVPSSEDINPGMAHFPGSGPRGKTCGDCYFRGYYRAVYAPHGVGVSSRKTNACEKFRQLTNRHGGVVKASWSACKYFAPAEG